MSIIRTGVDFAKYDGDKTVVVFLRYEDKVSTIVGELSGEAAEYVAALEARLGAMQRDLNNANIFLAERDEKLKRQAARITKLETGRASLREALAAAQEEE